MVAIFDGALLLGITVIVGHYRFCPKKLASSIKTLIERSEKKCVYCQKGSATVICHFPGCNRTFHQVCGFKENARFEYFGQFKSFCDTHNQIEDETFQFPETVGCFICREGIETYHPVTTIPSCCGYWFHQQCLRSYALNAGCSFMCPTCRNKNYAALVRPRGIFVSERDALWETTHDFTDIEYYYLNCDAPKCLCPGGRNFTDAEWNLDVCSCCGSYGNHKLCRLPDDRNKIIVCDDCKLVVNKWEQDNPSSTQALLKQLHLHQEEEGNIDPTMDGMAEEKVALDRMTDMDMDARKCANRPFENVDVASSSVAKKRKIETLLEEKRVREKAIRPFRDEMRDYLIGIWFRDYERFSQDSVDQ